MSDEDLSSFSMLDLFRVELDSQAKLLTEGLLALESDNAAEEVLESLMRAAHSLKGAARIVNLNPAVRVAHALEDVFVAAQRGRVFLVRGEIDLLLSGVDLLVKISKGPDEAGPIGDVGQEREIDTFVGSLSALLQGRPSAEEGPSSAGEDAESPRGSAPVADPVGLSAARASIEESTGSDVARKEPDRVLRVTADNLNRLLGLAGESLVETRWLSPFADSLLRLKRRHGELTGMLQGFRNALAAKGLDEETGQRLHAVQGKVAECRKLLTERLAELEMFDRRSTNLSHRLYAEALACRMRPFADGTHGFPRMVRDLAHSLGKEAKLEIVGEATDVDRDVLEKLEAPLTHLLRNAVDHGIETPDVRSRMGKPAHGTVRLEARHNAGMLQIIVADDVGGIDVEAVRRVVVERKLTSVETAGQLGEFELLEFLFLPGFTMKEAVSEISGRGVGLDVVQTMVKQVRGSVRVSTERGKGTRFQLQLPLTLSVVRTLLVEVGSEPYAFPLAYITRTLKLPRSKIGVVEGRQHFSADQGQVGLVAAHQLLGKDTTHSHGDELPVIVVGEQENSYGVVVDRFLGERELVVHPLDPRLGKIKDISAGGLMEDGSPVLIIDVEDLVRSIENLSTGGRLNKVSGSSTGAVVTPRKRILIVDDSLTVRELERKLLDGRGYVVEVAVDGMDGWNAVRTGHFNLVITDVDMPRMDGIELVTLIKRDANLKSLPVMIVSYKDREEDRRRGLEAGADYYLTKGSFHDDTLLHAVLDLIGEPTL